MGAVFFAILILITSIISLGLLFLTLILIICNCVMNKKKKKVKGLKIASIAFSFLTVVSLIFPVGSIIFLNRMYVSTYPTIGKVIDQKTFQDVEFSIDGEKYVAFDGYFNNRERDFRKAAFTYQLKILFFYLNSGYYYELTDDTMDFSLYDCDSTYTIFCKEEEKDYVTEYYENTTWTWVINNKPVINNSVLDDLIDISKSSNRVSFNSSELGSIYAFEISRVSSDEVLRKDLFSFYEINDLYYMADSSTYDYESGEYVYFMIPLTDEINDAIKQTFSANNIK